MRSSSWNDESPVQKSPRRGSWIKWLVIGALVMVGLPLLIGSAFAGMALSHRTRIWPAVRLVHARLQTDAGAKELFAKNPALAEAYASEEDFLDSVRAWRGRVGEIPAQEPQEGSAYSLDLDPEGAGVKAQGKGGAWMQVNIHGGTLADPGEGEGVVQLFFSEDRKGLEAAQEHAFKQKEERERAELRQLFQQCGEEASALALYRKEAGLRASYPTDAVFLGHLRPLRPAIASLLANPKTDGDQFHRQRNETPLGHTRTLTLIQADGKRLSATWRDGQLSSLDGDRPADLR